MSGQLEKEVTKTFKARPNMKHEIIATQIDEDIKIMVKPESVLNQVPRMRSMAAQVKPAIKSDDNVVIEKSNAMRLADICKTLSNPKRIEILSILKNDEKTVTTMVAELGASKANVSQHLAVMRYRGILATRRDGVKIYYRVTNQKIIEACALMKSVLLSQYAR